MNIDMTIQELDKALTSSIEEYKNHHEKLKPFTNRQLTDEEIKQANVILGDIQNCFSKMYPIFYFVASRYQLAVSATNDHTAFIEGLKKAGAKSDEVQ